MEWKKVRCVCVEWEINFLKTLCNIGKVAEKRLFNLKFSSEEPSLGGRGRL